MKRVVLISLGSLAFASVSQAAVIVDYNFLNNAVPGAQPASVGPTTVDAHVSSSAINSLVGTGGTGAGNGGGTNGTGMNVDYTTTPAYSGEFLRAVTQLATGTQTTEAQAVSTACYFNFIVSPSSGFAINISDITITGARGGTSTPRGFFLASSIENPGNTWGTSRIFGIGSEQSQRSTLTTYNAGNFASFLGGTSAGVGSLSLSGDSRYQNIATPTEFRFYVIAPSNGNSIDFTDFGINGTVVPTGAPEPGSIGIISLGGFGLLALRRRKTA